MVIARYVGCVNLALYLKSVSVMNDSLHVLMLVHEIHFLIVSYLLKL